MAGNPGSSALAAQVQEFVAAAKAPDTLRAYQSDWRHFERWCRGRELASLPAAAETVALYLADLAATHRPATLTRRLTSITRFHQAANLPSPANLRELLVAETLKGIRRTLGAAQQGKNPLLTADLLKVLAHIPDDLQGARDRALLLVGYAGGLRRSEIAALEVRDVRWEERGAVLTLRRSKTDQEGQSREVALVFGSHPDSCPVRTLEEWLERAAIQDGRLFRSLDRHGKLGPALHKNSIGEIVKRRVAAAGYESEGFAGHSLRAGFATQASINGSNELAIMKQTGHRSLATLRRYIRDAEIFRDSAAGKLGL